MRRQTHQELLVVTLLDLGVQIQQNFMKSLLGAGNELGAFLCAVYFPQWQSKTGRGLELPPSNLKHHQFHPKAVLSKHAT